MYIRRNPTECTALVPNRNARVRIINKNTDKKKKKMKKWKNSTDDGYENNCSRWGQKTVIIIFTTLIFLISLLCVRLRSRFDEYLSMSINVKIVVYFRAKDVVSSRCRRNANLLYIYYTDKTSILYIGPTSCDNFLNIYDKKKKKNLRDSATRVGKQNDKG